MKNKEGTLKNKFEGWKLHKNKKNLEDKENEFETIQNVTEKGKNGLKKGFGFLFSKIEKISSSLSKDNKKKYIKEENNLLNEIDNEEIDETTEILDIMEEPKNIQNTIKEDIIKVEPKQNKYIIDLNLDEFNLNIDNYYKDTNNTEINETVDDINNIKIDVIVDNNINDIEIDEMFDNNLFIKDVIINITNSINDINSKLDRIVNSNKSKKKIRKNIIDLKNEIRSLKKLYRESIEPIKETLLSEEIIKLDKFNLVKSQKELNRLMQRCNNELFNLKKQNEIINENTNNIESVIEQNIKEQQKEINELKKDFNEADRSIKRSILVTGIHNFLSKTIDICINDSTVVNYDDRLIEVLSDIIVLNNRIRNMRKIIRKENNDINYIIYENIKNFVDDKDLFMEKIKEIIEDAMDQIKNLKQEFIIEFYYDMDRYSESDDIMEEFTSIEYQITSKNLELEEVSQTI